MEKNFALQDSDPKLPTYFRCYNAVNKWTDLDYLRLKGNVSEIFKDR